MKKTFLTILFLLILFFLSSKFSISQIKNNESPSITVINLLRGKDLGHEKDNLYSSLKDQWQVTKQININATWLWQFSALEDKEMVNFAKKEMEEQEFGLLFEIDRNYAQKSGVAYRGQGPSYFSDGLLLSSYDLKERRKLIDNAFKLFKKEFGYLPKTVGAWWIGADSINYMQEKYGITAVLKASDQFKLDVYTIWGTPWNTNYISSKENEGLPAQNIRNSSGVVILPWAIRDPIKGYVDSTYSLQDYPLKNYDLSYVDYLFNSYLTSPSDNIVVGLENGGNLEVFNGFYKNMLLKAKQKQIYGDVEILLAKQYSEKFLNLGQVFSSSAIKLLDGYKSEDQSIWYNNSNYRVFIEKKGDKIYLSDLRDYSKKEIEDFSLLNNSQGMLWVGENYLIDSNTFPDSKKLISDSNNKLHLQGNNLFEGKRKIVEFGEDYLKIFYENEISTYFFNQKKASNINLTLGIVYLLYMIFLFFTSKKNFRIDTILLLTILIMFSFFKSLDSYFLFDSKELFLLYLFPLNLFNNFETGLIVFNTILLLSLPLIHFIFAVKKRIVFYLFFVMYFFLFLHFPYFPLEKKTILFIGLTLGSLFLIVILFSVKSFIKNKDSNSLKKLTILFVALLLIGLSIPISRSFVVLNKFELSALQFVKDSKRDIVYVSQEDYSVKPIYKATEPFIYNNLKLAESVTGVDWENKLRPSNHILNIDNYSHKLILVPRYLGSDLSPYEMEKLGLEKVFDNLQIAIYKKK